jgi:hypothetical protein
MNAADELTRLFAAERAETRAEVRVERGLVDLRDALNAGVPALPLAYGPLKLGGLSLVAKGVVISGLVLGVTAGGLALRAEVPPHEQPVVTPIRANRTSATTSAVTPLQSLSSQPRDEIIRLLQKSVPPRGSASAEPRAASTFAEELQLMKAAKQDLNAGKDLLAQVWLNEHARLYPGGVFRSERDALSVLIACRRAPELGWEAAQRYVARNPGSPLIDRISRACLLEPAARAPAPLPASTADFLDAGNLK